MDAGVQLKYGKIFGISLLVEGYIAASQTMRQASGRYVYQDAAGRAVLNADAVSTIWGVAEYLGNTAVAVDTRVNIDISLNAICRIPINSGTMVKTMIGDTCDISISSNIQGAQLDASDENTLIVVGGDIDNNKWVDVIMNPSTRGTGNGVDD